MVELAITEYEATRETPPPLVLAPGLFGAARNWRALAKRMCARRRVVAVDMRNHGASPWSDRHDYPAMAGDLAALIQRLGAPAAVLGHSMGGKAAMALAETRPELVERLIVADIAPVAYDHDLFAEIEAMRAVPLAGMTRRAEVEAALAPRIEAPAVRSFLAQSAILDEAPRWSLNLDALEAHMDALTGYPELGGRYEGPVLMLYGAVSDYVTPAHHDAILERFPAARFQALEGAGHWLHADRPREFLDAVNGFLDEGVD
ncbi:alpha/beta fold hydrolase [Pikeienuella piscinae]|uniref:alpha/beta fold hydrolase n=1 Tax=Pikeienuella piscinae TaxID=2748098 RepID=UPI001FE98792|nr:alpha/beta fold hydrolase [Pikeienuella piscinae]